MMISCCDVFKVVGVVGVGLIFGEEAGCFSLFLFVYVGLDIASWERPWMAIVKEESLQNGFSLCRQSFASPKIYLVRRPSVLFLGFLYWSGIILFSSDLFLFTFFRSLIGNPSFPFLFFLFISPFSFFSFLSLSLFFRSLIGNSGFSIHYSLSL